MVSHTIFVYLPTEAVDVWRPVTATHIKEDEFQLAGPVPDGETWEFQPGEIVRCREQKFEDGEICLVAFARVSKIR